MKTDRPQYTGGLHVSEEGALLDGLQLDREVAHDRELVGNAVAVSDLLATVVYILQRSGDYVHVVVGVGAARYGQTQQLQLRIAVLARLGVAVGQYRTDLDAADACFEVELYGKRLGDELLPWERA